LANTYTSVQDQNHNYYEAAMYDYDYPMNKSIIDNLWSRNYNAIANINNILENIDAKRDLFSSGIYELVKGESYALRAFLHFDLLRSFAPAPVNGLDAPAIPYVDAVSVVPFSQLTVTQIIDKVLEDLSMAEYLLKDVDPIGPAFDSYEEALGGELTLEQRMGEQGFMDFRKERLNYYAVVGLMARVHMYRGAEADKTLAVEYASQVINSGKFNLYTASEINDLPNKRLGLSFFAQEYMFSLYKYDLFTNVHEKYYETDGTRDDLIIDENQKNAFFEIDKYGGAADVRYNNFFDVHKNGIDLYFSKYRFVDYHNLNRIPLLKFSEMYLIMAECGKDMSILKELRRKRGLKQMAPDAIFEEEVKAEYRKELLGEGQMFYYFKRKNIAPSGNMTNLGKFVFPMPDAELERGTYND